MTVKTALIPSRSATRPRHLRHEHSANTRVAVGWAFRKYPWIAYAFQWDHPFPDRARHAIPGPCEATTGGIVALVLLQLRAALHGKRRKEEDFLRTSERCRRGVETSGRC